MPYYFFSTLCMHISKSSWSMNNFFHLSTCIIIDECTHTHLFLCAILLLLDIFSLKMRKCVPDAGHRISIVTDCICIEEKKLKVKTHHMWHFSVYFCLFSFLSVGGRCPLTVVPLTEYLAIAALNHLQMISHFVNMKSHIPFCIFFFLLYFFLHFFFGKYPQPLHVQKTETFSVQMEKKPAGEFLPELTKAFLLQ